MEWYHNLLHRIGHLIGHEIPGEAPSWFHSVLHVVLIWAPFVLLCLLVYRVTRHIWKRLGRRYSGVLESASASLDRSVFRYITRHTARDQVLLMALGLASLPILYATLELPKLIINRAIDAEEHTTVIVGTPLNQTGHLLVLCGFYLIAIFLNGTFKYVLNVYKGKVGERLLRRLRLTVFRRWRRGAGSERRSEVITLLAQEVEPIGGFASDAYELPVFQGGTFLTILVFMFVQDPYLGAAAVTMLPVQIALIPRLQRKVNELARRRVQEVRAFGGHLGDQGLSDERSLGEIQTIGRSLKEIETIRREIHRAKFFMKGLNNFLSSLTPFFFYSIGGYLVIQGDLTLGALVAVLAAYKDFSAPLRELFRYYQSMEDVRIRYDEIGRFLALGKSGNDASPAPPNPYHPGSISDDPPLITGPNFAGGKTMKNQLAVISALLLGFMPIAALADVTAEPLSGVTIEDASATTAGQGETSQVRFRISNSGVDDIALIGISSDEGGLRCSQVRRRSLCRRQWSRLFSWL